jgi:hypothetical protein
LYKCIDCSEDHTLSNIYPYGYSRIVRKLTMFTRRNGVTTHKAANFVAIAVTLSNFNTQFTPTPNQRLSLSVMNYVLYTKHKSLQA